MNIDLLRDPRVVVQGITGLHGSFHTAAMRAIGTNIVAGTSPNKAGDQKGAPIFASVGNAVAATKCNTSVIFVPARYAKDAMCEAINAGIGLIVCITEGIPVHDMIAVRRLAEAAKCVIIGPNCPGIIVPGEYKLGIIPDSFAIPGSIGIVSRSGTLTYEVMAGLSVRSIGQRYVIGIGGDRIKGLGFIDCLRLFEQDASVSHIVLIGEIGGREEVSAADYIKNSIHKPVFGYVAGHHAPVGTQLGHAGAILGREEESAAFKTEALATAGVHMSRSVLGVVDSLVNSL